VTVSHSSRRLTRPYVVASALTLLLAVLAMIAFTLRSGQSVPLPQIVLFALLSLAGLVLTVRYVGAVSPRSPSSRPHAEAETRISEP
jgi:membrane protein implicated in regulation of membrane protease activity